MLDDLELSFATHERWMRAALDEARQAGEAGDVPIGAVVVRGGRIIGRGHNRVEALKDPTAHAEILALGAAAAEVGDWRLDDCALYTTLEPCTMCSGAILLGRPRLLVYGAPDPRAGTVGSTADLLAANPYNLEFEVVRGILGEECGEVIRDFFRRLRQAGKGSEPLDG
ncbi:MAG TPA: tRNA adenosine(34) deaminase TadA [Candidatus Krumholzibacteria bacterium]|nr:tRNA adenosine(34) deaminase TadA [Candidatus Krumholzibacteria bacterium]HRX50099.1 tRNA adenosine(34) deaminase TadA [Candidatus Krumholzibacteria bacterium]